MIKLFEGYKRSEASYEQYKHSQLLNLLEPETQKEVLGAEYQDHLKAQAEAMASASREDQEDEKFVSLIMNEQNTEDGVEQPVAEEDVLESYNKHRLQNHLFGDVEKVQDKSEEQKKSQAERIQKLNEDPILKSVLLGVIFQHHENLDVHDSLKIKESLGQLQISYKSLDQYKSIWTDYLLYAFFCDLTLNSTIFQQSKMNRFALKHYLEGGTVPTDNEERFVYDKELQCIRFMDQQSAGAEDLKTGDLVLLIGSDHQIEFLYNDLSATSGLEEQLSRQFAEVINIMKNISNSKSASILIGYAQRFGQEQLSILIDPAAHENFCQSQSIQGYNSMRLFKVANIKYYQNLYSSFDNFDKAKSSLKPFGGIRMFVNPKLQKPILYRKANALDPDQGHMEMFIKAQCDKKILLESQGRALKHISALQNHQGDISLIQGGAGTGKTFVALQAIQMILKTKSQRVCMLLPDSQTLDCFIEQMHQSQRFMQDPNSFSSNTVILGRQQSNQIKLHKHKELNIDIKSLNAFLKLPKREDHEQLLQYLGFESLDHFLERFQGLIEVLRSGQAAEEVLRLCLKQRNLYSLSDLSDRKPTNFKRNSRRKEKKTRAEKIQKLLQRMFNGNQEGYEDFTQGIINENQEVVGELAEKYPNVSPDGEFAAAPAIQKELRQKQRELLLEQLAAFVEYLVQDEMEGHELEYRELKQQVLPRIRKYLISKSRVVITSIREGLGIQGLISQLELKDQPSNTPNSQKCIFEAVIVDNAHQVQELENLFILNDLRPGKLILLGDCQLPSLRSTACTMPNHQDLHFSRSLFERLIHGDGGFCILNQQVRMGRNLLEAVQKTITSETPIHGNSLRAHDFNDQYLSKPENIVLQKIAPRLCFYDLKYLPELKEQPQNADMHECCFVLSLLAKMARLCIDLEKRQISQNEPGISEWQLRRIFPMGMSIQKLMRCSIGILVPVHRMIAEYQKILARLQFVSNLEIQIGLPQDFQGIEKDVMIISHLRNSTYEKLGDFKTGTGDTVESVKVLNLTLTRARRFMWFVGNLQSISSNSVCFQNLGKHCMQQHQQGQDAFFQFESPDQWRNKDFFTQKLFSHCAKFFCKSRRPALHEFADGERATKSTTESAQNLPEDQILEQKLQALGKRTFDGIRGYEQLKKAPLSHVVIGGYFKRDCEGGQYNRINKFNNYTIGSAGGGRRGGRGGLRGGRGGFRGGYSLRGRDMSGRAGYHNQGNRPYDQRRYGSSQPPLGRQLPARNIAQRLNDRFRDRTSVTWDEMESQLGTWGGANKRQKLNSDDHW